MNDKYYIILVIAYIIHTLSARFKDSKIKSPRFISVNNVTNERNFITLIVISHVILAMHLLDIIFKHNERS